MSARFIGFRVQRMMLPISGASEYASEGGEEVVEGGPRAAGAPASPSVAGEDGVHQRLREFRPAARRRLHALHVVARVRPVERLEERERLDLDARDAGMRMRRVASRGKTARMAGCSLAGLQS